MYRGLVKFIKYLFLTVEAGEAYGNLNEFWSHPHKNKISLAVNLVLLTVTIKSRR
jgi:hypothetical protein